MKQYHLPVAAGLLRDIAARAGTPVFVYSEKELEDRFFSYEKPLAGCGHLICYALKANSNLSVCRKLAALGAGADVVSGGELARALEAGFEPRKIIFTGVGKTDAEHEAAIKAGILFINLESAEEAAALEKTASRLRRRCSISVRINPDIDPRTHKYISTGKKGSKFGVSVGEAVGIYRMAAKSRFLEPVAVHSHLGSQIKDVSVFEKNARFLLWLRGELQNHLGARLSHIDIGGGWHCEEGLPPDPPEKMLARALKVLRGCGATVMVEPGRSIAAPAGLLLAKVIYRKQSGGKKFAVVDAAMNDLLRPALYGAAHPVVSLSAGGRAAVFNIVGPVCESGDFLGVNMKISPPRQGDILAVLSCGAYGMSMSSQYNSRPRAAEVMVSKTGKWRIIRRRETYEDLVRAERC
ncbi:MAG: diaminopimelate decarboxylase [Elusimicrobiales bacterium]